jgi:hypothetical protein
MLFDCTDSFSTDEILLLKETLETKFSLKVSLQKKRLCSAIVYFGIISNIERINYTVFTSCMYYKFRMETKGI